MTWANRLRLIVGVVVILAIMAALTLLFNQRQSRVASVSAQVDAPTAVVGSGYGGVVIDQLVTVGQDVGTGDDLFVVASPQLLQDVSQGFEPQSNDAYSVDLQAGTITYHAVIEGQIDEISAANGSYLLPGATFARLSATQPKTVLAEYRLEATEYGRVERGAPVTLNLADNQQLSGTVTDISVVTEEGRALTRVRVESPELTDDRYANLTRVGAPVQAVLQLRDDGFLAGPTDAMMQFLTKIGLR